MGHPVPPDEPDIGTCPGCCTTLPHNLNASIEVPGVGKFEGRLDPVEGHPCQFAGPVYFEERMTPFYLTFCSNGGADAEMGSAGPIAAQCGGARVVNNHCTPALEATSVGDCVFKVWP